MRDGRLPFVPEGHPERRRRLPGRGLVGRSRSNRPPPAALFDADGFALRITGVGGTGVVTIAQILATAAAAEGRQVRTLDQTGLAQKGGAVVSDLKIGTGPLTHAAKLADGKCDLYLGCDSLVATDGGNLRVADADRTVAVVSTAEVPTGQMVVDTGKHFPATGQVMSAVEGSVHSARFLDAAGLARQLFDDEQYANMLLVGVPHPAGALPIGAEAIEHAIRLNGVAVETNIAAFRRGRLSVSGPGRAQPPREDDDRQAQSSLAQLLAVRVPELAAYQARMARLHSRTWSNACGHARRTSPTATSWPGRWPPTCSSWPPTRTSTRSPGCPSIPS